MTSVTKTLPFSLPRTIKIGWAIGQIAVAGHMAIISIFLLYYLTDVHHFPGTLAGSLILVPRLWNAIIDPLVGGISDRVHSRWGRRRPFLLLGSIIWGISFAAMFWMPDQFSLTEKATWFLVSYTVVNTGLSFYHVPYSAMVPEMTQGYNERLSLIGYREVTARLSVLLTVMAGPIIVKMAPNPLTGNRWLGLMASGLILASGITAFFATKNAPAVAFQPQLMSWRDQLRTLKANKPVFVLSSAYLLTCATDAFYSAMLIYFLTITMKHDSSAMGLLYPTGSLTSIVMTPVWAWLGSRLGKQRACTMAFAGTGTLFLIALLLRADEYWLMFPFMVCVGACIAGMFLLPNAMIPDTVEYDEAISGMRREGTIYGAWIFTQQTGMAFGTFLVGVYLDLIGHKASSQLQPPAHEGLLVRLGFALVPAAMLTIAIFALTKYRLDPRQRTEGQT
jgi:sugar (glycoside-pentoside-hexuronide) transporter